MTNSLPGSAFIGDPIEDGDIWSFSVEPTGYTWHGEPILNLNFYARTFGQPESPRQLQYLVDLRPKAARRLIAALQQGLSLTSTSP